MTHPKWYLTTIYEKCMALVYDLKSSENYPFVAIYEPDYDAWVEQDGRRHCRSRCVWTPMPYHATLNPLCEKGLRLAALAEDKNSRMAHSARCMCTECILLKGQ